MPWFRSAHKSWDFNGSRPSLLLYSKWAQKKLISLLGKMTSLFLGTTVCSSLNSDLLNAMVKHPF